MPQYILQDAAMTIILNLDFRIQPGNHIKFNFLTVFFFGNYLHFFQRCDIIGNSGYCKYFFAGKA